MSDGTKATHEERLQLSEMEVPSTEPPIAW